MDDVDAVHAQIARTMLETGDWITPRVNGVLYVDKAPLNFWLMAASYAVFGVHDWAARIPMALASMALCWLAARCAAWAVSREAGLWTGVSLAACVGLFLFTRIRIPDVALTLCVTAAVWGIFRALEDGEPHPRRWSLFAAAAAGCGVLLKGLIAVVFPAGIGLAYLAATGRLFSGSPWRKLHLGWALIVFFAIAAPWHIAAALRNPPYLDWTLVSRPGEFHGFFWRYFINEHLLRYLGLRHPRDYSTVPLVWFWLLHLVWLFPWSALLPAAVRLDYGVSSRAGRLRRLALCWAGFVLVFFSFSTTQEYYTMPAYPAFALLVGSAIAAGGHPIQIGTKALGAVAAAAALGAGAILYLVWETPAPGDISRALTENPEAYTLSLGHMQDLTLDAFAYLRTPLAMAGFAFAAGAAACWLLSPRRALIAAALMMVVVAHAARVALARFDPYLSSRHLAEAFVEAPEGLLIADGQYWTYSSVFFYADARGLLFHGRVNNLEYGSNEPGAPAVFIGDEQFRRLWLGEQRCYLVTEASRRASLAELTAPHRLHTAARGGGKLLLTNHPLPPGPGESDPRMGGSRGAGPE